MFDYTVRDASGRVIAKTITRDNAERISRETRGAYVKDKRDPVYPLKEES